jgi:hypothetical protein
MWKMGELTKRVIHCDNDRPVNSPQIVSISPRLPGRILLGE